MYELNTDEKKDLEQIESLYYMKPILKKLEIFIQTQKSNYKLAFNKIYDIFLETEKDVRKLLQQRQTNKEIQDVSQAMKSIAGNAFSNCMIYLFLKNKIAGNIKPYIYITSKKI